MIEFSYVSIPPELSNFLKSEVTTPKDAQELLSKSFRRSKAFERTVLQVLGEFDSQKRLGSILTSLGLKNFRDRFTSIFVYRWMNGLYPAKSKPDLVGDISKFEDIFFNYRLHSSGRVFLLGTYLTMMEIQALKNAESDVQGFLINFPREIVELLEKSQGRSTHLDIIILVLWHGVMFWGFSQLKAYWLERPGSYLHLFEKMSGEQKALFLKNILTYSASIQDEKLFFWEQIA